MQQQLVLLFCVAAAAVHGASLGGIDSQTDSRLNPNLTIDPKLPTLECKLQQGALLGYDVRNNRPVYQASCGGLCRVALKLGATECRPDAYKYYTVRATPAWYTPVKENRFKLSIGKEVLRIPYVLRTVRVVESCGCQPKSCTVNGHVYAHGATVYNDCNERCQCQYGQLRNCCRQRKSILHMPTTERLRYMQVLYDVSTGAAGAALKTEYDTLIADHQVAFSAGIHAESELLPWHRNFILMVENVLRKRDCRVTLPYYPWELTSADPWGSQLWNPSTSWFGGGSGNACVPDGKWTLPWTITPSAGSTCLRRSRVGTVPTPADVATLLATPAANFPSFNALLNGMHGSFHCTVGGTMCTTGSANAPEFFLHHGNMDRLWAKWQAMSPAHKTAFNSDIDTVMTPSSLAGGVTPREMLDIGNHQGVCVNYVEPGWIPIIGVINLLATLPQQTLLTLPSRKASYEGAAREYLALHNMTADDMRLIDEAFEILDGRPDAPYLDSVGASLGAAPEDLQRALLDLELNRDQSLTRGLLLPAILTSLEDSFIQLRELHQ